MVEARATAKHVRGSPSKARLVIDLIRGKKAADALLSILAVPGLSTRDSDKMKADPLQTRWREVRTRPGPRRQNPFASKSGFGGPWRW